MRIIAGEDPRGSGAGSGQHEQLQLAHCSMQFSDTPEQMRADVDKLTARAVRKSWAWCTGTEAGRGADPLRKLLHDGWDAAGYRFWMDPRQDSWIAVRKDLIAGGWDTHYEPVIPGVAKHYAAKGVLSVGFDTFELGRINIIACHYLTHGRPSAKSPEYRTALDENRRIATAIGDYAVKVGAGSSLVFYGGDQNIVDRTDDSFFGKPLTSAWDELKRYDNTGHGNIDVIASYDRDGRVRALDVGAYDDHEFRLNTDHYLIEARYSVRKLLAK